MLAAIPDSNLSLGLLEAVLTSLSNNQQPILSENLKNHFISVLRCAAALANNPGEIDSKTSSEAIELAFRMQGKATFLEAVSKLDTFGSINSEDAKFLLNSLKKNAA